MAITKDLDLYAKFLQDQIAVQRKNMRFSFFFFILLIFLGILATLLFYKLSSTRELSDIIKIGPSIILATISSIQFKPFAVSRERVSAYQSLKTSIEKSKNLPKEQVEMIKQIIADIIKDTMKR